MVDAREYHERTKHSPERLRESDFTLDPATKPRPYKQYTDLPRERLRAIRPPQLPALSAVAGSRAAPGGDGVNPPSAIDRETLATLCYEASGIVEHATLEDGREMLFRAGSCTGKLYHIDLYPVVGDLDGLAAGVYHFDPRTFSLDVLREGDYRGVLAAAVGASAGEGHAGDEHHPVEDAPVTFVATSTWWRNAWKYRERTYRHAFWDAGTVLANLLAAAHATGRKATAGSAFADGAVADLLGVDPEWEAPVALATVGSDHPAPPARDVEQIDPGTEPVSPETTAYPLIHDAWQQSTLADGMAAADWRSRTTDLRGLGTVQPGDGERISLDPVGVAEQSGRPLAATIRRRRSCREYASRGPSRRQVGTVLDRATRGVPGDWNGGTSAGLAFNDCYVLATGVEGLPDGTYQYHPGEAVLERLGDVTPREQQRLALNQGWAGDAHVNVYLLADIGTVVDRLGNRGYRLAQLEAGITLGRLYLATYAHRPLGGTGLTFFDDLVTEHCSPRASAQTPTCLFAFGRAH